MGGWVSTFNTNNPEEEEEKRIKKYEEQIENNPYGYGLEDTDDLRHIKWWQRIIYDMRFRISYTLILGILLGLALPIGVYYIWFNESDSTIYGSCLIKTDARFQCLINNAVPANRKSCVDALCCWEENDSLPFKCFHSFPSAYQYRISGIDNQNDIVQLDITPNHKERMAELRITVAWIDDEHINFKLYDPRHHPSATDVKATSIHKNITSYIEPAENANSIKNFRGELVRNSVSILYGEQEGYAFVQIIRNSETSNETIFDTRLGPMFSGTGNDFIYFTTTLPTPYFYGLKGGEGISSRGPITYGVLNGFENSEMPFYMSLEDSGLWHGVLLDTTFPFMVQVLQAPGIAFHIEGPSADVNLHLFVGPNQTNVMQQLHAHISTKLETASPLPKPYIPPYWGLGLHLCRNMGNGSLVLEQLEELNELISNAEEDEPTVRRIPYDSDCIDESFRNPFDINQEKFSTEEIDRILDILSKGNKKLVLVQRVVLPTMMSEDDFMLVMDKTNSSNIRPFSGMIDKKSVHYSDVFHPNAFTNVSLSPPKIPKYNGLILLDNFPKNEKAMDSCKSQPGSYLQKLLIESPVTTWISSSNLETWGSICPDMVHSTGNSSTGTIVEKFHFHLHNIYGLEAMKKFRGLSESENDADDEMMLFSSSSGWTESLYFSGHNGMEVAFSWIGLRESLAHVVRSFILSPFASTPICGSYLPNERPLDDSDLCLRWYQVALVLPFAYQSYAHGNISRGPLNFSRRNQDYLTEAIRQRYTYAPYYYTLFVHYSETLIPPITPMSYYFHGKPDRNVVFKLVDQFMIGEGLLAAPIVTPGLSRETYFPSGVWYDVDGYLAWDNLKEGGFKTVTGHKTQTPLFIRGGHILPTLQNPQGNSIMESRAGNYTLLVGLQFGNGINNKGALYTDPGIKASPSTNKKVEFTAATTLNSTTVVIELKIETLRACDDDPEDTAHSTVIDEVKLIGFPISYKQIEISQSEHLEPDFMLGDEINYLRLYGLNINWCLENSTIKIIGSVEI